MSLELARSTRAGKSELLRGIVIVDRLAGRFPDHLESHASGNGDGVECWPFRLVDNWNVTHFDGDRICVRVHIQAARRNWYGPVKSGR
jgi:hypothetical protein